MKQHLLFAILALPFLSGLAGIEYSDIVRWGLVRRADLSALLPADGYRMVCTTNESTSWVWTLNGSMTSTDEGNPTVLTCDNQVLEGMPMNLVQDGLSGLFPIGTTGYSVGPFLYDIYGGFGVVHGSSDPLSGPSCWSEGYTAGQTVYSCSSALSPNFFGGGFTLTRADTVTITATTNFVAVGGGAVLRDLVNPRKFARLENGVFKVYEIVEIPSHWEFGGVDCPELTFPLTAYSGSAAGYTWSTMGESFFYSNIYDGETIMWCTSSSVNANDPSVTNVLFTGQSGNADRWLIYVAPSFVTNSL